MQGVLGTSATVSFELDLGGKVGDGISPMPLPSKGLQCFQAFYGAGELFK
jgi:hypothetical protein